MFNFGNANVREAILTSDVSVLITAGPSTGKLRTLYKGARRSA